jgi:CRP-like cAMP-binding protein
MDLAERMFHLRRLPLGAAMTAELLVPFAESAIEAEYAPGERLLASGHEVDRIIVVMQGAVRLERHSKVFGRVTSPGLLGVRALVARMESPYDMVAEGPIAAFELDAQLYLELLEDSFSTWLTLMRFVYGMLVNLARQGLPSFRALQLDMSVIEHRLDPNLVERMMLMRQLLAVGPTGVNVLAEVAQSLELVELSDGEVLFRREEPAMHLYVVVDGALTCDDGADYRFEVPVGSTFGGLEAFADVPRWCDAVAHGPTRLLRGRVELLLDVLEDNPSVAMDLLASIGRRTFELEVATWDAEHGG